MPDEEIDLVDERDRIVGSSTIRKALASGQLHRAVAVVVVRSSGAYLLQQRSRHDVWHPGLWTLSSTGHVKKGEAYREAAARELLEELGIVARLSHVKKFLLPPICASGLTEFEWTDLFETHSDAVCKVDPAEVERVREVGVVQLSKMVRGRSLTPDAVIILRDYLKSRYQLGA